MNNQVISILRCPISQSDLRELNTRELTGLNERAATNELCHLDGTLVSRQITAGLITLDGRFAYVIEDNIALLLPDLALPLGSAARDAAKGFEVSSEKKSVQTFYNEVGWQKGTHDAFVDANKYEDLRPVASEYVHKCRMRIGEYIKPKGKYLLDVASGPVQFPEYLTYSSDFEFRICVDLSFAALREAKRKLGDKAVCVLGDITNLPIKPNSVDSAISLHTIYHVPMDEQRRAFEEVHRVLAPEGSAVVVYSWGPHSILLNVMLFPLPAIRSLRRLRSRIALLKGKQLRPKLYAHMHDYKWFTGQRWGFDLTMRAWRSMNIHCSKVYIHRWLFGRQILNFVYKLENAFPSFLGRVGAYPMFVLKK